jgi:hypothetical protein
MLTFACKDTQQVSSKKDLGVKENSSPKNKDWVPTIPISHYCNGNNIIFWAEMIYFMKPLSCRGEIKYPRPVEILLPASPQSISQGVTTREHSFSTFQ